jgi:hypothetical protein
LEQDVEECLQHGVCQYCVFTPDKSQYLDCDVTRQRGDGGNPTKFPIALCLGPDDVGHGVILNNTHVLGCDDVGMINKITKAAFKMKA